jgi:hypothetical protein
MPGSGTGWRNFYCPAEVRCGEHCGFKSHKSCSGKSRWARRADPPVPSLWSGRGRQHDHQDQRIPIASALPARARLHRGSVARRGRLGAWQRTTATASIGGDLYPSGHQFGIPGYRNPVAHPYEIVYLSLKRARERTRLAPVRFRPWLQISRLALSSFRYARRGWVYL